MICPAICTCRLQQVRYSCLECVAWITDNSKYLAALFFSPVGGTVSQVKHINVVRLVITQCVVCLLHSWLILHFRLDLMRFLPYRGRNQSGLYFEHIALCRSASQDSSAHSLPAPSETHLLTAMYCSLESLAIRAHNTWTCGCKLHQNILKLAVRFWNYHTQAKL